MENKKVEHAFEATHQDISYMLDYFLDQEGSLKDENLHVLRICYLGEGQYKVNVVRTGLEFAVDGLDFAPKEEFLKVDSQIFHGTLLLSKIGPSGTQNVALFAEGLAPLLHNFVVFSLLDAESIQFQKDRRREMFEFEVVELPMLQLALLIALSEEKHAFSMITLTRESSDRTQVQAFRNKASRSKSLSFFMKGFPAKSFLSLFISNPLVVTASSGTEKEVWRTLYYFFAN